MRAQWPLVGRRDVRGHLLRRLRHRSCPAVLMVGAPGVGKSRLAREVCGDWERTGGVVCRAVASAATAELPLGAFAAQLSLPPGASSRTEALAAAAARLTSRSADRPLLVSVDDVHLLDPTSEALLHHLLTSRAAAVLCTARPGEAASDTVLGWWKDGLIERIELPPLEVEGYGELLEEVLDGAVEQVTVRQLWDRTEGIPLFLREVLLAGLRTGALRRSGTTWRWYGPPAVGERLEELVLARLTTLPGDVRDGLELLAAGEPLSVTLLERLGVGGVLATAEREGLLAARPDGARSLVRLAHPLYGEVLRAATPVFTAREAYRRLVAAVEATGMRRRDDLLRVLSWRLAAGLPAEPDALLAGAWQAQAVFDLGLAESLARRSVQAGGGVAAGHALGATLAGAGRRHEAERCMASVPDPRAEPAEYAALTYTRAMNLLMARGEVAAVLPVLAASERLLDHTDHRYEVRATRAVVRMFAGQHREAAELGLAVVAEPAASARARYHAYTAVIGALPLAGRLDPAFDQLDGAMASAQALSPGIPWAELQVLWPLAYGSLLAGRLDDAETRFTAEYERSVQLHWRNAAAAWGSGVALTALFRGQPRTARRTLQADADTLRDNDPFGMRGWTLAMAGWAAADSGDPAAAAAAVAAARDHPAAMKAVRQHATLAQAWVLASSGDVSAALDEARRAADGDGSDAYAVRALALHTVARFGWAEAVAEELAELVPGLDGPVFPLYAAHAQALADRDGDRLDAAAAGLAGCGLLLVAAETATAAAAAHGGAGRAGRAAAARERCRRWLESCEDPATPALRAATGGPTLTPRERQIALHAARGDTSRRIAADLGLSTRTVDNHLASVYAKLGIGHRQELSDVL